MIDYAQIQSGTVVYETRPAIFHRIHVKKSVILFDKDGYGYWVRLRQYHRDMKHLPKQLRADFYQRLNNQTAPLWTVDPSY